MLAGRAGREAVGADGVALLVADEDFLARAETPHARKAFQLAQQRIPGQLDRDRPFATHHGQGQ